MIKDNCRLKAMIERYDDEKMKIGSIFEHPSFYSYNASKIVRLIARGINW